MRMIITENDIPNLIGRFIIQLDADNPDVVLNESNWAFYEEKRISMVSYGFKDKLVMQGFYYQRRQFEDRASFVEYFNKESGDEKRFHRLLTKMELAFVFSKMRDKNY